MSKSHWCGHGKYNSGTCAKCKQYLKENLLNLVKDHRSKCDESCNVSLMQIRKLVENAGITFTDDERQLFF
jgi:hypothetical protein